MVFVNAWVKYIQGISPLMVNRGYGTRPVRTPAQDAKALNANIVSKGWIIAHAMPTAVC